MAPVNGKYQVLKHLASGGMAEVFLARERSASGIEKLVVLKRVLPQHNRDPEYLRMFRDEARISALLQHPNLVQMFEMGSLEGLPFISMEYLNGEDVRGIYKVLRQRAQPLRLDFALTILTGVTAGLHYAHELVGVDGRPLNIVHRDISPQNVVVTYEGGVKLVDFGIARAENRMNQTKNAVMKGKISYMSPEQVLGETLDRRCDVYAVGVMLYEMTTGQRPFHQPNEVAMMRAIIDSPLAPPQKLVPGYPPELSSLVMKALSRDRSQRFQTAQELHAALEDFAAKKGLSLSNLALNRFMRELFGARAEAYREVLAGVRSIDALPLDAGQGDEDQEPAEPDTTTTAGPSVAGTGVVGAPSAEATPLQSFEHAELQRAGPVTVVHFSGKLNERFSGAELGRALSGVVVFDLRRVERVTSFGVREWLQMLAVCESRLTGLYLAHCSEAVVSQLSMIKRFAGPGKVVSFYAPYQCVSCSNGFQALIEIEEHFDALSRAVMPPMRCPSCRAQADFDDDARSYLAFGPARPGPLSPVVESVLTTLRLAATTAPEAVEKSFEGTTTRVTVRAPLDGAIRWRRVLDGVEGEVLVELTEATRFEDTGVRQFGAALTGLADEVTRLVVEGAPRAVLEAVAPALAKGRVTIGSVQLEGHCAPCKAARMALVRLPEVQRALEQRRAPFASCKRCNGALEFKDLTWLEALLGQTAPLPAPAGTAPEAPLEVLPSRSRPARAAWGRIGLGAGLLSLAVVAWLSRGPAPTTPPAAAPPVPPPVTSRAAKPAWAEGPSFRDDGAQVTTWSYADTVEAAENEASLALAERLAASHPQHETFARRFGAQPLSGVALADALKRTLGAAPQREVVQRWVQLQVSHEAFEASRALLAREVTFRGATLCVVPPPFGPPAGALYVVQVASGSPSQAAGLRAGDLVLEFQGAPIATLAALDEVVRSVERQPVNLKVDAQGMTRSLRVAP